MFVFSFILSFFSIVWFGHTIIHHIKKQGFALSYSRKPRVKVSHVLLSVSQVFLKAVKTQLLSQAFSGSAGGGTVMGGLTGTKTECGSTSPSVAALYNTVWLTGVQTLPKPRAQTGYNQTLLHTELQREYLCVEWSCCLVCVFWWRSIIFMFTLSFSR